jgi:galactokinase/mevalonate kinase-like predicted kinase
MVSIVASAPGRCGIVGNPTDMYGGSVLSCTVQERAECRLTLSDGPVRVTNDEQSASLSSTADLEMRSDKIDIVRAALRFFKIDPATAGFDIALQTRIPMQAGMAGSTAMLAAIVGVLDAHYGWALPPYHLAEATRKVEARVMGVVCGFQDQHMAVFGGLNFMDFAGKETLEQGDEEPLATIEPLASFQPAPPLLLANTGVKHHSGTVHRSPRERWLAGEPLVREGYARIAELARRAKRALIEKDWTTLGALMNENHGIVADLGGSGPVNEQLINAARDAGALGAKLAGAGGGGTIIALTLEPDRLGRALLDAGAQKLLTPAPVPGLTVTRAD